MTDNIADYRQQALEDRVLLIAPTLSYWRGQYQLRNAEVRVAGHVTEAASLTRPQTKLLEASERAKAWRQRFQDLDTERNAILKKYSVAFPIHGVRVVPRRAAADFFYALVGRVDAIGKPRFDADRLQQSVAYRLTQTADEFCANYFDIMEDIRQHTEPSIWAQVADYIPNHNAMRGKFDFTVSTVELTGSKSQKVNQEDLAEFDTFIRESTKNRIDSAIAELIGGPRQELAEALTNLEELIRRDGRVSTKSFKPVKAAIEKLQLFDFVADGAMLERINTLTARLDNTVPKELDHVTASNNGLYAAIAEVRDDVLSAERAVNDIERFGRPTRGFDFS